MSKDTGMENQEEDARAAENEQRRPILDTEPQRLWQKLNP